MILSELISIISSNLPLPLITLSVTILGGIVGQLTNIWLQDLILAAL
jgi:hypothetical protein